MRVFLSWSGESSRPVAEALHDWLPNVVQEVKPWMSSADITPGVRWPLEVGRRLEEASFGVVCLTAANLTAPWILFEAGALGKQLETSRVVPYRFRVGRNQVVGPLSQFQDVEADCGGTRGLVGAIHGAIAQPSLTPERLTRTFDKWWPDLEQRLHAIPPETSAVAPPGPRADADLLNELLEIVRGLQRDMLPLHPREPARSESPYLRDSRETAESLLFLQRVRGPANAFNLPEGELYGAVRNLALTTRRHPLELESEDLYNLAAEVAQRRREPGGAASQADLRVIVPTEDMPRESAEPSG